MQTLFVHMKLFSKSLFIMYIPKKINCVQNLLCIHSTVENLYKNSAVEMLHLID